MADQLLSTDPAEERPPQSGACLHRWFLRSARELVNVGDPAESLEALVWVQDALIARIEDQLLDRPFCEHATYSYIRRHNGQDGVVLWFTYIESDDRRRDEMEQTVDERVRRFAEADEGIQRDDRVLGSVDSPYARTEAELDEFYGFLALNTDVCVSLLSSRSFRREAIVARWRSSRFSPSIGDEGACALFWAAVAPQVVGSASFELWHPAVRRQYVERFLRVVKRQQWCHFMLNMMVPYDPHPAYRKRWDETRSEPYPETLAAWLGVYGLT